MLRCFSVTGPVDMLLRRALPATSTDSTTVVYPMDLLVSPETPGMAGLFLIR